MEKKTTLFNWLRAYNYNDCGYHRIGLVEMSRLDSNSILFEDALNIRMSVLNSDDKFCSKMAYSVLALKPMKTLTNVRGQICLSRTSCMNASKFIYWLGFPKHSTISKKYFGPVEIDPIIRNMELLLSQ